jgi:hypothetical protein
MPHRFRISQDSQALFITVVTRNRLPVFKTDQMKTLPESGPCGIRGSRHRLSLVESPNLAGLSTKG